MRKKRKARKRHTPWCDPVVAHYAQIPEENVDPFLEEICKHCNEFNWGAQMDEARRKLKAAVNEIRTISKRLLRAVEYFEGLEGSHSIDLYLYVPDFPLDEWVTTLSEKESMAPPLFWCKRPLTVLKNTADYLSEEHLPKRNGNRTKILIENIWRTAEKHGGELTFSYDKSSKRISGTLMKVLAHVREQMTSQGSRPLWTDYSPSTIERLRPP